MSLHRKTHSDSRIQRLTSHQKDAIFVHCQTASIREAAHWIKHRFNLQISKSSLSRWLQEQRIERSMDAELAALRDNQHGAALINEAAGESTPLTVANSVLFASAVFNEFRKPEGERDENRLIRYMDLALKARDLEIRASAVQLAFERFRFDAARKHAGFAGESQPLGESAGDEREKTQRAMELLFGERPAGFRSESGLPVAEMECEEPRPAERGRRQPRQEMR